MDKLTDGYKRESGPAGIRNKVLVLYTVNCSAHNAQEIALHFREKGEDVDVIGNESCFDNQVMINRMLRYATHPNVGAALIVTHGCEFIPGNCIADFAKSRGRKAEVVVDQKAGSTATIEDGIAIVDNMLQVLRSTPRQPVNWNNVCFGLTTACSQTEEAGSAVLAEMVHRSVAAGAAVIYQPTTLDQGEIESFAAQLDSDEDRARLIALRDKSSRISLYSRPRCCQNDAGLLIKMTPFFRGVVKIAEKPAGAGLWLLDAIQDTEIEKGYNPSGIATDTLEYAAGGALFSLVYTDRGLTTGNPIAPVLKIAQTGTLKSWQQADIDVLIADIHEYEACVCAITAAVESMAGGTAILSERRVCQDNAIFRNVQTCR